MVTTIILVIVAGIVALATADASPIKDISDDCSIRVAIIVAVVISIMLQSSDFRNSSGPDHDLACNPWQAGRRPTALQHQGDSGAVPRTVPQPSFGGELGSGL